jgi:hypothetical protein
MGWAPEKFNHRRPDAVRSTRQFARKTLCIEPRFHPGYARYSPLIEARAAKYQSFSG